MIELPWTEQSAPNVSLEIVDACNVRCQHCYKRLGGGRKTLAEIRADLADAKRLRPLHTVSLSGGEPTLHPDLPAIVRMIKEQGIGVFLLTNGAVFDAPLAARLRESGLDAILFHLDPGQDRPDIGKVESFAAMRPRLGELIGLARAEKLDVSLSYTLRGAEDLPAICDVFFADPDLSFLFLARGTDLATLYTQGRRPADGGLGIGPVADFFRDRFALLPYAAIPAADGGQPCWISFFQPYVDDPPARTTFQIRANTVDVALMRLYKLATGRFVHKTAQKPGLTAFRVLLNGLASRRLGESLRFLRRARPATASLRHKMVAYDDGPRRNEAGEWVRCAYCPTAIVRDGALLPCCVADYRPETSDRQEEP